MEIAYAYFIFCQNKEIRLKRGGVEGGLTNEPPLDYCIKTNDVTAN
jgi:hypothetical protein